MNYIIQIKEIEGVKIKDDGEIGRETEKHTHFCIHSLDKHTRSGNNGFPEGAGAQMGAPGGGAFLSQILLY